MAAYDRLTQTRARIAQFAAVSALTLAGTLAQPAQAAPFTYKGGGTTATPTSGLFSTGFAGGPPTSASDTSLILNGTSSYTATDDIAGAFTLNNLTFNSTATDTVAANLGNSLNFVTNGGTMPTVTQSGAGTFNLNIPAALTNSLNFNGTGAGNIISNGILSGPGGLTQSDPNNTLTLGLTQTSSTITSGSTTVTVPSTNGLIVGQAVTGNGIPTGDTIASITDATHFVLNTAATLNGTAVIFGNTFSGGTTIAAGTVASAIGTITAGGVSGFGTGAITLGDTSGGSNATLSFGGNNTHLFNAITVASGSSGTLSIINPASNTNGTSNVDGLITLANNLTIQDNATGTGGMNINSVTNAVAITGTGDIAIVNNSGSGVIQVKSASGGNGITINGKISHTGTSSGTDIIQAGLGSTVTSVTQNSSTSGLSLSGNNVNFVGALNVQTGKMFLGGSTSSTSILATVNSGGTLDVGGNSITLAGVNDGTLGGGTATNSAASLKTLTLGGSGAYAFSGTLTGGANLAVTKSGTGTQTLSGANTYSGTTTISAGALRLDNAAGSGTGTGVVTFSGGALSGAGSETGKITVTNGAVLASGDNASGNFGTVGTLGVGTTGGATLTSAALDFDFSASALSGNDLLTTGGTLGLGTLSFTFNELTGTLDTTNPYTLISGATGVTGFSTAVFNTAFTGGTGYTPTYSLNGSNLQVSFAPIAAAPEPSQGAALLVGALGLGGLALKARRRTRAA